MLGLCGNDGCQSTGPGNRVRIAADGEPVGQQAMTAFGEH